MREWVPVEYSQVPLKAKGRKVMVANCGVPRPRLSNSDLITATAGSHSRRPAELGEAIDPSLHAVVGRAREVPGAWVVRVGLPLNAATSFLLALVMRALDTVPIDRRDGAAARRQLAKLAAAVGDLLPPGGRLALRPGRVTVELLAPIPTTGLGRAGCESLRDQTEEAVTSALKNGPPLSVKRAG